MTGKNTVRKNTKTTEKPLKMTEKQNQKSNRKPTEPKERKTREKHHRKPPQKPLLILAEQGKREKEKEKSGKQAPVRV